MFQSTFFKNDYANNNLSTADMVLTESDNIKKEKVWHQKNK